MNPKDLNTRTLRANFRKALKTHRKAAGMIQCKFAAWLGVSCQQAYQRYESGRIPKGDVLYRMATQLGVTVESLLAGEPHYAPAEKTTKVSNQTLDVLHRMAAQIGFTDGIIELGPAFHAALVKAAEARGLTLNQFIAQAIEKEVGLAPQEGGVR